MALTVGTNSYTDLTFANAYFADSLRNTEWSALTDAVKEQALVTASRRISLSVIDSCQLPLTPPIDETLQTATSEFALAMAIDATVQTQPNTSSNIQRLRAGPAEIEFFRPESGTEFPFLVQRLLADSGCLESVSVNIGIGKVTGVVGDNSETQFGDLDQFGLNEGY